MQTKSAQCDIVEERNPQRSGWYDRWWECRVTTNGGESWDGLCPCHGQGT